MLSIVWSVECKQHPQWKPMASECVCGGAPRSALRCMNPSRRLELCQRHLGHQSGRVAAKSTVYNTDKLNSPSPSQTLLQSTLGHIVYAIPAPCNDPDYVTWTRLIIGVRCNLSDEYVPSVPENESVTSQYTGIIDQMRFVKLKAKYHYHCGTLPST